MVGMNFQTHSNMPLRGLFYFSSLYQGYVARHGLNLYSSAPLAIPRPVYMVFYNGKQPFPEQMTLRLSDSYMDIRGRTEHTGNMEENTLEVVARVWNINYGKNEELTGRCRRLHDYAYLIERIRFYQDQGQPVKDAVNHAVSDCIEENVLREFLLRHRGEVCNVILTEYDEELHIRSEKELSFAEGQAEGLEHGIRALIQENLEEGVPAAQISQKLQRWFYLSEEDAYRRLKEYMAQQ